jgi:hypothetical protein
MLWVRASCTGAADVGDVKRKRTARQYTINTVNCDDVGSRHHGGIVKFVDLLLDKGRALSCEILCCEIGTVWL